MKMSVIAAVFLGLACTGYSFDGVQPVPLDNGYPGFAVDLNHRYAAASQARGFNKVPAYLGATLRATANNVVEYPIRWMGAGFIVSELTGWTDVTPIRGWLGWDEKNKSTEAAPVKKTPEGAAVSADNQGNAVQVVATDNAVVNITMASPTDASADNSRTVNAENTSGSEERIYGDNP